MTTEQPFNLREKIQALPEAEQIQFSQWLNGYRETLQRYKTQAEAIPVKMPAGDFIPVDGAEIKTPSNPKGEIQPSHTDPDEVETRLALIGKWGASVYVGSFSDKTLTFVGPDGRYWVGLNSAENIQNLAAAGYLKGDVKNNLNESCIFIDPGVEERWKKLLKPSSVEIPALEKKSEVHELADGTLVFEMTPEEIEKQAARLPELESKRKYVTSDLQGLIERLVTFSADNPDLPQWFGRDEPTGLDEYNIALYAACLQWANQNGYEAEPLIYNRSESRWETRFTKKELQTPTKTAEVGPDQITETFDPSLEEEQDLTDKYWERYKEKKEELENLHAGWIKNDGETGILTAITNRSQKPLGEDEKEYLSALRHHARQMDYEVGPFDIPTSGDVTAKISKIPETPTTPTAEDWQAELRARYYRELDSEGKLEDVKAKLALVNSLLDQGIATPNEISNVLEQALNERVSAISSPPKTLQPLKEEAINQGTDITQPKPAGSPADKAESVSTQDWQSQLRLMMDKEFATVLDEGLSKPYNDFVQNLYDHGIRSDQIAEEAERYVEERKKSAATSSRKENTDLAPILAPVIPVVPHRQEITLGREVIGTSPEGLINGINQILTKSASSEISFSASPKAVIDYLETIELPYGAKIKEANTQIRGNQLSIVGSVSVPAMGDVKFNATLAPDSTGKLTITSYKVETSLRLRLMKGKIENGIAYLDQKMAEKINQKVDPRWRYAGFHIAGNQIALDFNRK